MLTSILKPLYLLKHGHLYRLILGQKPCFLGPIQLVRQKVNIHYNTYWYNLANIQDAITLFFSQIIEFCMWFDNQEELMKESKVWNIKKKRKQKNLDDFMWPIYYGLGKYGTNKIQKSLATEINLRETELIYNWWKSILKKIPCLLQFN